MVRVTAGVEAHTHEYIATAHEDQKFGFSIASGDALEAVRRVHDAPAPRAARPALPHRLPDLRHLGVRGRRPPRARAARPGPRRARRRDARDGPRRRLRHRLHDPGRPVATRRSWPPRCARSSSTSAAPSASRVPRLSIEPGRAIVGPAMCTVYEVGTVKEVALDGGARAHLRLRRRRDERQHPHRPLRRRLLRDARLPRLRRAAPMLSRVVGKHCEAGDIVVKDEYLPADIAPGRPARRARAPAPTADPWPPTTTTCCARR